MKAWVILMSKKNCDRQGRFRSLIIGFRVSPEENEMINHYVELSGLTKQDYLIKNMLHKEIKIYPNPKVYKALKDTLNQIYIELKRIECSSQLDEEYLEFMKYIFELMKGFDYS